MGEIVRTWRTEGPLDLRFTLAPIAHGDRDPTVRWVGPSWWRATRTPDGPATLRLSAPAAGRVCARAWGPGADWALEQAPELVGGDSPQDGLSQAQGPVGRLRRQHEGLRMCRTRAVFEALVPFVLEQKVTTVEAKRSWWRMASAWGEPAPGPAAEVGVKLGPAPERLVEEPYWRFHQFGIERKRADIVRAVSRLGVQLEETAAMTPEAAEARLRAVPGIGPWTSALVGQVALGDSDAAVIGDYNFPHIVTYTMTGEPQGSDALMLELLEPYRPWRGLAQRLLVSRGLRPRRRAPRAQLRDLRAI